MNASVKHIFLLTAAFLVQVSLFLGLLSWHDWILKTSPHIFLEAQLHHGIQLEYKISSIDRVLIKGDPRLGERVFVVLERTPAGAWRPWAVHTHKPHVEPKQLVLQGRVGHRSSELSLEVYYGIESIHLPAGTPPLAEGTPLKVHVALTRSGRAMITGLASQTGKLLYEESVF